MRLREEIKKLSIKLLISVLNNPLISQRIADIVLIQIRKGHPLSTYVKN
jgi:hypothetical protein